MAFYAGQKLKASSLGQLSSVARYSGSATQTIGTGSDTVVSFPTADVTSAHITRATTGAGHKFTIGTAGLWTVSVTVRWASAGSSATGHKAFHLENAVGTWLDSTSVAAATQPITQHLAYTDWFDAGDWVQGEVYQDSGGNEDLEYNATNGWPRIVFAGILLET